MKKTTITKNEKEPAVVFFPTNQDSECMDGATEDQKKDSNSRQVGHIDMDMVTYGIWIALRYIHSLLKLKYPSI